MQVSSYSQSDSGRTHQSGALMMTLVIASSISRVSFLTALFGSSKNSSTYGSTLIEGPKLFGARQGVVDVKRNGTYVMRTEDRYFDLSVYVIPAMQMVTSLGSEPTSPPVDMLRPFSRMFLAYSRAACENRQMLSHSSDLETHPTRPILELFDTRHCVARDSNECQRISRANRSVRLACRPQGRLRRIHCV